MVIINSSGGVVDRIEGRLRAAFHKTVLPRWSSMSLRPRKISHTNENQALVTSWVMENDAFAALAELKNDKRIDPTRIGMMGVSKGGSVAQNSAMMVRRELRRTGSLVFALHVPIVPDCVGQFRNAATTGRPSFYMVAELDDLTPAKLCLDYADRMKAAGTSSRVSIKVHPGRHHGWELTGPVLHRKKSENHSTCAAMIEGNGDRTMKASNKLVGGWNVWQMDEAELHGDGAHVELREAGGPGDG